MLVMSRAFCREHREGVGSTPLTDTLMGNLSLVLRLEKGKAWAPTQVS